MQTSDHRFSVYPPQPAPPYAPAPSRPIPWSTGLCHFSQCSLWCVTCLLPCLTFGQIAEIVDEGSTSCATHAALYAIVNYFTGCVCVYAGLYREKIRQQYGLEESPCNDYCTHCCCHRCALRQEYRELELRGFDLSIACIAHAALYTIVNYLTGSACVYSGFYRAKIRQQYGSEESPCNDYCLHCCCHSCALCQEYGEVEHRGFDLSIGWNRNIQRKIREEAELVQSAPTMPTNMHREGF